MSARPEVVVSYEPCWSVKAGHIDAAGIKGLTLIVDGRPLVVIDPEDREQIEKTLPRLREQIEAVLRVSVDDRAWERILGRIEDDLSTSAAPPKPEEPAGLGAVVEASDGALWVRVPDEQFNKNWRKAEFPALHIHWDSLDAVRVLSEGVPA